MAIHGSFIIPTTLRLEIAIELSIIPFSPLQGLTWLCSSPFVEPSLRSCFASHWKHFPMPPLTRPDKAQPTGLN